jgi:hypothetical protein
MNDRLSTGEQVAGVAGLALILIMFLFAWFGFPDVEALGQDFPGADAFDALSDWVNIILVFTAFSGISLALFGGVALVPISLSVITTVLGGLSAIIIFVYILSPPHDLDREIGVWLGLIAAACVGLGGYLTMQEEGTSFADVADTLSGPGGGHGAGTSPPSPSVSAPPPPPPAAAPPPQPGTPPPPPSPPQTGSPPPPQDPPPPPPGPRV